MDQREGQPSARPFPVVEQVPGALSDEARERASRVAQTSYDSATFARIAVSDVEAFELLDNGLRRALLLEGEFGVAVQSPPDLYHAGINALCLETSLGHDVVSAEHCQANSAGALIRRIIAAISPRYTCRPPGYSLYEKRCQEPVP